MKDDLYLRWVSKALLSYQMVEEALKLCIGLSYEIIAASNPPEVDFKFSPNSINNAPLGSLIKMFSNVSKNEVLVAELKSKELLKWRNFFAHNAFQHEFISRNSKSSFTPHSAAEVKIIAKNVGELVLNIGNELKRLQKIHGRVCNDQQQI